MDTERQTQLDQLAAKLDQLDDRNFSNVIELAALMADQLVTEAQHDQPSDNRA